MEALERIRAKITRREPVFGTHISLNDPSVTELLGLVGFDFLWIDTEHSAIDRSVLLHHLIAARSAGKAAFVRVPWNDPVLVKPVLEMGIDGVVFPMIRTVEDARLAVASCLYPPEGIRGFGPRRAIRYGLQDRDEYLRTAADGFWRILQIEHHEAVDNLEGILKVRGVSAIVVGPNDLSGSVGLLGQTGHPTVVRLLDRIADAALAAGVPFGASIRGDPALVRQWMDRGAAWIAAGSDMDYIATGAGTLHAALRALGPSGRA